MNNLNVEALNIDELKDFFEIKGAIDNEIIRLKINEFTDKANILYTGQDKDVVIDFINKAELKMVNYCNSINNSLNLNDKRLQNTIDENYKLDTFNLNYKKGTFNPLKKQTRILNLVINSIFRKNYSTTESTNYVYRLPTSIKNVVSMKVASIELPNTVPAFNKKDNTNEFSIITYTNNSGTISEIERHIIQIPTGMYALDQIIEHLNNSIFTQNTKLKRVALYFYDYTGSFHFVRNTDTTKNGDIDPTHEFDIDFRISSNQNRPIQLNMGWMLGYRKPYYKYSEDYNKKVSININNAIEGFAPEAPINIFGTSYFFLHINDYNNNTSPVYETVFQEGLITSTHIMDKIQNTGSKKLIQNNLSHNIDKVRRYYGPVNIDKLEIKLLDQYGRVVNLLNSDFSFTLQLEILYNL